MSSMNKKELIAEVSKRCPSLSNKDVASVIAIVFEVVLETLTKRGEVRWAGFGSFKTKETKAREGRNPQTGEKTWIEAKVKPVLQWAAQAKHDVSEGK
jgi:DNA-binding protein HU-beta